MNKLLICFALLLSGLAGATPGGLDGQGCHASKAAGYHCHAGVAAASGGAGESATARDRRLRRECKGQRNRGVCQGYGSTKPDLQYHR